MIAPNHSADSAQQEAIWDYFQNDGVASFDGSRQRLSFLAREATPGAKVLNIGVGNGCFENEALRRGVEVWSLDPSQRAIDGLRQRLGMGQRAQAGYAQAMPFADASFSLVVASEVFEHLDTATLKAALVDIHRVLVPGGKLLGTVPAREALDDATIVCPCCAQRFHRWGHQQSFTVESMQAILGEMFAVESVSELYFAPWNVLNWKGRITGALKAALASLGIHGRDENLVFRARKSVT